MTKHLVIILKEMCTRVGADYEKIDFKADNWFWSHEWTLEQENDFKNWLYAYLKKNKSAIKELTDYPRIANLKKLCSYFAENYGWKIKTI